jgi:GNAT superfamily N-acetyltransferase
MCAMVLSEPAGSAAPSSTADAPGGGKSDDSAVRVTEVPETDWRLWREMRLEALADAPTAFGETLARAETYTEDRWRSWWRDQEAGTVGPRYIARVDGEPAAMASICFPDDHGNEPLLISMWASPKSRGRGAARRLLDACIDYSARTGHARLLLGVVEDNLPARRLYERYGFTLTGGSEPLHSDPSKTLLWMQKPTAANVAEA